MLKFLQINLQKSSPTRYMLDQAAKELRTDPKQDPRDPLNIPRQMSNLDAKCAVALAPIANFTAVR